MKKFFAIFLALIIAMTSAVGFAAGTKSPTVQDLYRWTPAYTWTEMQPAPTMENIEFAKDRLIIFLGEDYELIDAFNLNVAYPYAIVKYETPYFHLDGSFIMILKNEDNTYYFTPIIIENTAVFDFTNIESAWYEGYVIHSDQQ